MTNRIGRLGLRYGFARRFVAGETLDEALRTVRPFAQSGQPIILNHLGENVASADEARRARDSYVQMLRAMHDAGIRGNIAVKLTQLGLDFDPQLSLSLAGEIAAEAARLQNTIEIDMEGSAYTNATLRIFEAVQREHGNAGIAIQAYLFRSQADPKGTYTRNGWPCEITFCCKSRRMPRSIWNSYRVEGKPSSRIFAKA